MNIKKIVVGIDFSPYSDLARFRACELAATTGAEIVLVHAFEDEDYQGQKSWLLSGDTFEELLAEGRRDTEERLERVASECSAADVKVRMELSEFDPDVALLNAVERHGADLVAIGTHGRTGFERLTLARIAERVVRKSPCSVLVARPSHTTVPSRSRILVPTDFSESAEQALTAACSLVAEDGEIDVLHCWTLHFFATGYHGLVEEAVSLEPEIAEAVRKKGAALVAEHSRPGIRINFEDRHEAPARGIHEALETKAYDLVVMGSHGRRGVERFLLGSAAEATVRHANCSVLVVREPSSESA